MIRMNMKVRLEREREREWGRGGERGVEDNSQR